MTNELHSVDKDGKKYDHHLHAESAEQKHLLARLAIARALRKGWSLERALHHYGPDLKVDQDPFKEG